jgi:phosphatidylinositol glycan class T
MLLPAACLLLALGTSAAESYHESLTLHPLPDGKLSVSFDFTTYFEASDQFGYHNALTPPSLLLPLAYNEVSELTISFVTGKWDQKRSGESGPLQFEAGGGGGEIRGWLKDGQDRSVLWM